MNISNCYEICNYYHYFDESNKFYCVETCPKKYNKLIINKKKCIDDCKKDDTFKYDFNNICYREFSDSSIANDMTEKIREKLNEKVNPIKELILNKTKNTNISSFETQEKILKNILNLFDNGFNTTFIDEGEDVIITMDKYSYTITSTENQKNNKNKNETTINMGECETKLKEKYYISKNDSLCILKIDALINNIHKVEYEVYYQFTTNNLTKLDLSVCKNIKIDISIPIEIPKGEIDKYNMSSTLYNDICNTLTS